MSARVPVLFSSSATLVGVNEEREVSEVFFVFLLFEALYICQKRQLR